MNGASSHHQRLQTAIGGVSRLLETYAHRRNRSDAAAVVDRSGTELGPPVDGSALDAMAHWFNLTEFELAVVVLAAGIELSPEMPNLCALAQGDRAMPYPTVSLALAAFAELDGASQAAFAPSARLRFWPLITTEAVNASSRLQLHFSIPSAVLSFLIGQPVIDDAVAELIHGIEVTPQLPSDIALARLLSNTLAASDSDLMVHLVSSPTRRALGVAAEAVAALGFTPFHLPLAGLTADAERLGIFRLWQRDRLGVGAVLLVSFEEPPADVQLNALDRLLGEAPGPTILIGAGGQSLAERAVHPIFRVPLPAAAPDEVADHLAAGLGGEATPSLRDMTNRFRLPLSTLSSCAAVARKRADAVRPGAAIDAVLPYLLPLLRDQVRETMAGLADPIPVRMSLDDVIVPAATRAMLDQIVARQRNRTRVLDEWGFRHSGGGAQGMSVLFAGPSGTGKTMTAEALAHALQLDLYRVDLSRIVDKYVGETEKRLAALFDTADATDAILLFDEADVLFGRRTEVRDGHDHYANLEVGYLLQRVESFRGIAILTTNLPKAIDDAFSRRFAFTLHFEFPTLDERRDIWRRAFPAQAPVAEIDWDKVARLSLSGGQIRVVVVNAAMLAAEEDSPIRMPHIARALICEYGKQNRRVALTEFEGWSL